MKLESMELTAGDAKKNGITVTKSIDTNIALISVMEEKNQLKVDFEYTASYVPDGSHIHIAGKGVFSGNESKAAADEFAKNGRITGAAGEFVMNAIYYASSVNGVLVARAFNMMPPVSVATLAFEGKKK
jgi:hypothetical protein